MKILLQTTAALAMISAATVAHAGPNINGPANPGPAQYYVGGANGVNTPAVGNNVENATPTVTNSWTISGNVTQDCSVYTVGGNNGAHTIDIGQIGVNTQSNVAQGDAFEMVSPIAVDIASWTAGCNFRNTVSLAKSAQGLVNASPAGYDNTQFQANIPYSLSALFNSSVTPNAPSGAHGKVLTAGLTDSAASDTYGAWRSRLLLQVRAPQITDRALVAGTYSDTITVTLAAN